MVTLLLLSNVTLYATHQKSSQFSARLVYTYSFDRGVGDQSRQNLYRQGKANLQRDYTPIPACLYCCMSPEGDPAIRRFSRQASAHPLMWIFVHLTVTVHSYYLYPHTYTSISDYSTVAGLCTA